jgi:nitrite reductase/ring-hydroxylating ferredoxin subunit
MENTIFLCALSELPAAGAKGIKIFLDSDKDDIFLVRAPDDGRVLAYWNDCPHLPGSPLAWAKDRYLNKALDTIICSSHGAQFNLLDGICFRGPCMGDGLLPAPLFIDEQDNLYLIKTSEKLK